MDQDHPFKAKLKSLPDRPGVYLMKDGKGKVIRRKMVYAGNPFTELELTEFSLEQIKNRSKNRLGLKRMNFNIKPGKSIPFMIVFEKLPEDLSEFTVEAVSSSPGT